MSQVVWGVGLSKTVEHAWDREEYPQRGWQTRYTAFCRLPLDRGTAPLSIPGAPKCKLCVRVAKLRDEPEQELRRVVGAKLRAAWPRALPLGALRRAHRSLRRGDRLEDLLNAMEAEQLVIVTRSKRVTRYTARKGLREA